jgi:hypothetical protein
MEYRWMAGVDIAHFQSLKVVSMDRLPPINGRTRRSLEQTPSDSRYDDKRLDTMLSRRLRSSFALPDKQDDQMDALLKKLAAKLDETPPED